MRYVHPRTSTSAWIDPECKGELQLTSYNADETIAYLIDKSSAGRKEIPMREHDAFDLSLCTHIVGDGRQIVRLWRYVRMRISHTLSRADQMS